MDVPEVVLDTNVLVAALRSRRGASFRLLELIDSGKFGINLSVALMLEYEDVCRRQLPDLPLTERDLDAILSYICRVARHRAIPYLWRPFLKDPKDDMVLELAVSVGGAWIVTFNVADFRGAEQLGVRVMTPRELLGEIGEWA
jgi:putative PIN family toxin of toxin-antitoxin system